MPLNDLEKLDIKDSLNTTFINSEPDKNKNKPEEELYDTLNDPFEMNNLAWIKIS